MTGTDPRSWTVDLLSSAYRSGELSPVEVTQACLERIEDVDPALNAFVGVDAVAAIATARESQERWRAGDPRGDLDGVPVTVKDIMPVRGWSTRKGSNHTAGLRPADEDAPTPARLREAGAVLLGSTTTPEFGWKGVGDSPFTGITRNPWDPSRTPGGSSAGAAVAAATGMGVLHVGTDGGGSIRMPAAFCGVFGLKPTHAIVPIHPAAVSGLLSHIGPMTRTVRDAAHLMRVIARPDPREVYPSLHDGRSWLDGIEDGLVGLKVAYAPVFARAEVDSQIAAAVQDAVHLLAQLGAEVELIGPPGPDVHDAFLTLWDAALCRALAAMTDEQLARSDPGLVATAERGRAISAQDYLDADAVRGTLTQEISTLLTRYDVLVSPTVPVLAFAAGSDVADPRTQAHWVDWTPFTYPLNMTRHPAAAVPVGLSREGLPMSMQVVGRHFADRTVLRVARAYERECPFAMPPAGGSGSVDTFSA